MSLDPAEAFQRATFAALSSSQALQALIGTRVYDRVEADPVTGEPTFPFVTVSDAQVIDASAEGLEGSEVYQDVHVWSRAVGQVEAKQIADGVRDAMSTELDLTAWGHVCVAWLFVSNKPAPAADPDTTHRIVTLRYCTEPA